MADIHVKDENPLYKLKDAVLEQTEKVETALREFESKGAAIDKETAEVRAALEQTRGLLENVNKRMDEMDKQLPRGEKHYTAANGEDARARAREGVGMMVVDLARKARGLDEKYDFWKNARTQKEGNVYTGGTPDAGGGVLVPPEQANEIIRLVSNFGLARKLCRIMPMTREVMRLPVATYGPTTLVGQNITSSGANKAVTTEASGVGQSTQAFTRPEMVATRLMALDNISLEVDEDSTPDLMSFLVDVFAEAVALAEDFQVLRADHTPFTGVMVETGTAGIHTLPSGSTSFKNIKWNDLIAIYNKVDEKLQENGVWVMSNYVWNQIQTAMVDNNGRPFNLADNVSSVTEASPRRLLGRPVYTSTVMPKAADDTSGSKFLIYGDFKHAIFGDRKRMSIDISPHAGFTTGELVMRVMERFAFVCVNQADGSNTGSWSVAKTYS
jgi:HK97 family phage major capsid protein